MVDLNVTVAQSSSWQGPSPDENPLAWAEKEAANMARNQCLEQLRQDLQDEIVSTQDAFRKLEDSTAKIATKYYNYDYTAENENLARLGEPVKDKRGTLSIGPMWIGPVIDQMLISLVGENGIGCAVNLKNPAQIAYNEGATAYLAGVLKENMWRQLQSTAVTHIGTARRAIFKVGWQKQRRMRGMTGPVVNLVRPHRFWFDLEALIADDCAWMCEACVYSEREFRATYANPAWRGDCECPEGFTSQMSIEALRKVSAYALPEVYTSHAMIPDGIRGKERRILVYEHYDMCSGTVTHILARSQDGVPGQIILQKQMVICPYVVATLAPNGIDARGASEAVNIIRQQFNLAYCSDRLMNAANASKSGLVVDGRYVNKDTQFELSSQGDCTIIAVGLDKGAPENMTISQAVMPVPQIEAPAALWALSDKIEKDIGISVAWAEMQQGRASGFRSASEAQLAEAHLRGRIVNKAGSFNEALAAVAQKVCWLIGNFSDTKVIEVQVGNTGNIAYDVLKIPTSIFSSPMLIEVAAYNPVTNNPMVMAQNLVQMMPTLQQLPDIDWRQFAEVFISVLGSPNFLKPKGQVADEKKAAEEAAAAQMQAATQAAMQGVQAPGAPAAGVPAPGLGEPGVVAPQAAGMPAMPGAPVVPGVTG